jgi:exodeoxyribonuclease V gamma subunit
VQTYREGLAVPLPLPPKTACAYAEKRHAGMGVGPAAAFAGKAWRSGSGPNTYGEFSDTDHQRAWGEVDLAAVLGERPDPGDPVWPDEPHRFGQLARRVWTPMLEAETVHE